MLDLKAKYENTTVSKYIVPDIKLSRFILPVACIKAVNNVFITFTEFAKSIHLQKETANGGTSINHNDIIFVFYDEYCRQGHLGVRRYIFCNTKFRGCELYHIPSHFRGGY